LDIDALLDAVVDNSVHTKISSQAEVVNDKGHIAGYYTVQRDGRTRDLDIAFIYRPDTGVERIPVVRNRSARIIDLNNKDQFIGKWINSVGDESYFIHRHGWENLQSLTSVAKINDSGDILGLIAGSRGILKSSVAIWKEDYTVVDLLQDVVDCDQTITDDCAGDNRLDFDYWENIAAMDLNNQGQIVFIAYKPAPPGEAPETEYGVFSINPGMGIKQLYYHKSRWIHSTDSSLDTVSINNHGLVMIKVTRYRTDRDSVYLYSSNGIDQTPGTVLEERNHWGTHTINDSNVLLGFSNTAFSLTDAAEIVSNSALFPSPYPHVYEKDINNSNVVAGNAFNVGPGGDKSKALAFMPTNERQVIIDGRFDDWEGRTVFSDAIDDGGTVNWDKVWADDKNGRLSFSYTNIGDIDKNQLRLWNIYLDSDKQSGTGYNFELLGADYLLQGENVYQYTGNGQDWSWSHVNEAKYAINGNRAELSIEKSTLGLTANASSYRALFYGTDTDGGNLDYLLIDVDPEGGSVILEEEITIPDSSQE
jgi:hypothetical protein